jgi:hypothetical protein
MVIGAGRLDLYLTDHDDRPMVANGHTGKALLLIAGKKANVTLRPAGGNRLSGSAPVSAGQHIIAIVTIEGGGKRLSARFTSTGD